MVELKKLFTPCRKLFQRIINVIVICRPGVYSDILSEKYGVKIINRANVSVYGCIKILRSIGRSGHSIVLHTHNRIDMLFGTFLNKKIQHIHTFHSAYPNKNFFYMFIKPKVAVSISNTVKNYLSRHGIESTLIYNGIQLNKTRTGVVHSKQRNSVKKLLFVGRLSEEKGILELIEAMHYYSNEESSFHLTIIGDGELKKEIRDLCDKYGLCQYISILGSRIDPWENAEDFHLLIIPSRFEGFGLVGVEGAVNKIPIVASNIEVLREVLYHLDQECFFRLNEPDTLVRSINYVFQNYDRILTNASYYSSVFSQQYSLKQMISDYEKLYADNGLNLT
jgi:glycosyltransferase involved in cell wall biosynthesis